MSARWRSWIGQLGVQTWTPLSMFGTKWAQSLATDKRRLFYSTWPPSFSSHSNRGGERRWPQNKMGVVHRYQATVQMGSGPETWMTYTPRPLPPCQIYGVLTSWRGLQFSQEGWVPWWIAYNVLYCSYFRSWRLQKLWWRGCKHV